ncbi:DUF3558 domain-containing protein [Amycolatopsis sp. NBC_00345]|uniref:DUF3558 domain-containing protein n=1 Tax=Amycolatopsis sp. NBC_00345 TaxID=2975955 RepID=UPI002E26639E
MNSTKSAAILCALAAGSALLTACGPKQPTPILDQPPTPVRPGAAIPFTPVKQPLDPTPFEKAPCQILDKEQVAAVVADPPSDVQPFVSNDPTLFRCNWTSPRGPLVTILEPLVKPQNLTELAASRSSAEHGLEPWSEVSLDGYPVVIYHEFSGPNDCNVAVGISDAKMLQFSYRGETSPSHYWDKDRCGGVLKTAEFVLTNLRHH